MKKIVKLSAILCLSTVTGLAIAAQTGGYVGGGLGASNIDIPKDYQAIALGQPTTVNGRSGLGGRIFGGFNFNEYFGVEAGVAHYAPVTNRFANGNAHAGNVEIKNSLNAIDLVGKAYLPLGESGFNIYGLGGIAYVANDVDFTRSYDTPNIDPTKESHSNRKIRPVYGIGASYDIPQTSLTTNVEFTRIQGNGDVKSNLQAIPSANMLTLNLAYHFS